MQLRRNSEPHTRNRDRKGVPLAPIYENEHTRDLDEMRFVPLRNFMSETILMQARQWNSSISNDAASEDSYHFNGNSADADSGVDDRNKDNTSKKAELPLRIIVDNAKSYIQPKRWQRCASAHSVMMLADNRWEDSDSSSNHGPLTSSSSLSSSSLASSMQPRSDSSSVSPISKTPLKSCLKKSSKFSSNPASSSSSLSPRFSSLIPASTSESSTNFSINNSNRSVPHSPPPPKAEKRWGNGLSSSSLSNRFKTNLKCKSSAKKSGDFEIPLNDDGERSDDSECSVQSFCSTDEKRTTTEIITQAEAVVGSTNYTRYNYPETNYPPSLDPNFSVSKSIDRKEGAPVRPERVPSADTFCNEGREVRAKQRKAKNPLGRRNFQWDTPTTAGVPVNTSANRCSSTTISARRNLLRGTGLSPGIRRVMKTSFDDRNSRKQPMADVVKTNTTHTMQSMRSPGNSASASSTRR